MKIIIPWQIVAASFLCHFWTLFEVVNFVESSGENDGASETRSLNLTSAVMGNRTDRSENPSSDSRYNSCGQRTLNYTGQICVVPNAEVNECLVRSARLLDHATCSDLRPITPSTVFECTYAEICIFTAPEETKNVCSHNCTIENYNEVTCRMGSAHFTSHCLRSFVHCPIHEVCTQQDIGSTVKKFFLEDGICHEEYARTLGRNVSWYWLNQRHFNNDSKGFGDLDRIYDAHEDEDDPCLDYIPVVKGMAHQAWIYVIAIVSVFILAVFIALGVRRYQRFFRLPDPSSCEQDPMFRHIKMAFTETDSTTSINREATSESEVERAETIFSDVVYTPAESPNSMESPTLSNNEIPLGNDLPVMGDLTDVGRETKLMEFLSDERSRFPLFSVSSSIERSISGYGSGLSSPNAAGCSGLTLHRAENTYTNEEFEEAPLSPQVCAISSGIGPPETAFSNIVYLEDSETYESKVHPEEPKFLPHHDYANTSPHDNKVEGSLESNNITDSSETDGYASKDIENEGVNFENSIVLLPPKRLEVDQDNDMSPCLDPAETQADKKVAGDIKTLTVPLDKTDVSRHSLNNPTYVYFHLDKNAKSV